MVSQNNLVNIFRLRALVQDRDEPVRSFVARLKGTAGVLDKKGRPVMLSVTKPVPHMLEVEGRRVVAMPRVHPSIRVQVEVNKATYEKTGLPLRMGKSSMT